MSKCGCSWKDLVKWIMPFMLSPKDEYNAPPEPMVEAYVRLAAYNFAFKSGSIREKVRMDLNKGVCDYFINTTSDVLTIKKIEINGMELTTDEYEIDNQTIFLNQVPTCEVQDGLMIEYSMAPCTDGTCDVPEGMCTRYRQAIINGALGMLYSMSNMDWYNANEAQRYNDDFEDSITEARADSIRRTNSRRCNLLDSKKRYIT